MINSTGGRLSPHNISDPLIRVELYREIRDAQKDSANRKNGNWGSYTIQISDALSPELVAHKSYGLDTLKWVVCIAAGLDNTRESLEIGTIIYLPKTTWLRERIKHYVEMCR